MLSWFVFHWSNQPIYLQNSWLEREKVQELHSLARETLISIGFIRDAIPEGTGKDTWKFPRWIHENNIYMYT